MSAAPAVSVLVAVYNVERYVGQCLDSLLAQTCQDAEFIVVDDGSTDSSGQICRDYAARDERIRLIRHKENRGTLLAHKTGILASRGEWLMWLDGDDYFTGPDAVERALAAARESGAGVTLFEVTAVSADGGPVPREPLRPLRVRDGLRLTAPAALSAIFERQEIGWPLWNKVWLGAPARAVAAGLPDESMSHGADKLLCLLLVSATGGLAAARTRPLVRWRVGSGVSTGAMDLPRLRRRLSELRLARLCRDRLAAPAGRLLPALRRQALDRVVDGLIRLPPEDLARGLALALDEARREGCGDELREALRARRREVGHKLPRYRLWVVLTLGLAGRFRERLALLRRARAALAILLPALDRERPGGRS